MFLAFHRAVPGWLLALIYSLGAVLLLAGLLSGMQWLLARIYHEPLRETEAEGNAAREAAREPH